MKLKLCFVLSSIAFLVACQTTPSEIPSPSSVEQRTIQVATPASLPSPEPTAASPPTEVPIDLPTQAPTAEATDMPSDPLQVPSGNPPTIDGTHSPSEWDAAAVETFVDGSQLLLMQAGDFLYLGIRANVSGTVVGNVYILHGDEVAVLHSSAALGTAIYEKGEESWQQIQDFDLSKTKLKDRPSKGYISFQDEAKRIWYRNVKIKELK